MEIVVKVVSSFISFINLCQKAYRFRFKTLNCYGILRPADLRSGAFALVTTTLRPEIEFFLEEAEKPDPRLCDHDWMIVAVFCMGTVTEHMNQLIINLGMNESPSHCGV
jgi:hypothetical protein